MTDSTSDLEEQTEAQEAGEGADSRELEVGESSEVTTEGSADSPAPSEADVEPEVDEVDGETPEAAESRREAERRQSGRKGVRLNRLIASRILDGESHRECYLHLVDISEGGLRVNSDDPFPEGREFQLEIGLAAFGNELATRKPKQVFPVRLVWSKSLLGGMVVTGLAFTEQLDGEGHEVVSAIMHGASPEGRRMHFRLNRVLGVEMGGGEAEGDEIRWLYPLTLDLSVEGMRICLNEELQVGRRFPIKIFLEFDLPTVSAEAEVMWQETMPSGRVQVGLRFEGLSERDAAAIKTYIDQCLRQDDAQRSL